MAPSRSPGWTRPPSANWPAPIGSSSTSWRRARPPSRTRSWRSRARRRNTPAGCLVADALRSEWLKLRTARANLVLLVLAFAVPVALTALVTGAAPLAPLPDGTHANRFSLAISGTGIGHTLLAVLGVLVIGSEFRHNTIRITFSAVPRRLRVHAAKIVTVALVAFVAGVVAVGSSYAVGAAILGARDHG